MNRNKVFIFALLIVLLAFVFVYSWKTERRTLYNQTDDAYTFQVSTPTGVDTSETFEITGYKYIYFYVYGDSFRTSPDTADTNKLKILIDYTWDKIRWENGIDSFPSSTTVITDTTLAGYSITPTKIYPYSRIRVCGRIANGSDRRNSVFKIGVMLKEY